MIKQKSIKQTQPPYKLRSMDLFTGIGGLTHALQSVAEPVVYCENDPVAIRVIERRIETKDLPHAPIAKDIRDLNKAWLDRMGLSQKSRIPQLILAGFPCVGFSSAGSRQGFQNPESALFFELLRIIDTIVYFGERPYVFLENVPQIIHAGLNTILHELTDKRGYTVFWTAFSAAEVGAPQVRKRWYCLALPQRKMASLPRMKKITPYSWEISEPRRIEFTRETDNKPVYKHRIRLLGNSIVPLAASVVYEHLRKLSIDEHCKNHHLIHEGQIHKFASKFPHSGASVRKSDKIIMIYRIPRPLPVFGGVRDYKLVLRSTSPSNQRTIRKTHWAALTRTDGMTGKHTNLTTRAAGCIKAQIQFEKRTPIKPGMSWEMSPTFAEWLMGFPLGWTHV